MFPDLKIAFCISGEPRQYKNCYKHLLAYIEDLKLDLKLRIIIDIEQGPRSILFENSQHLLEQRKKLHGVADLKNFKVTVDIFIHSWNTVSTHRNYQMASIEEAKDLNQHITYDVEELRDDLIEKYNPKRILVESKDVMDDLYQYYANKGLLRNSKDIVPNKWMPPYFDVEDLKDSNYLALMQHISGERSAYLKSGTDIICQSGDIIGDTVINDYDITIKTRTDVFYSAEESQFFNIIQRILNFEGKERTPNGMTYFIHQNIRNGNLAVSLTQWWSNNKQFDMLHRNFVERLLSYKQMPIRHTCHHDMIGYHIQKIGISSREWNSRGKSTDFGLYVPGTPESFKNEQDGSARQTDIMRNFNREYQVTHHKRMKESEKSL